MTFGQIQNECAYMHTHKNKEKQNKTARGTGEVIELNKSYFSYYDCSALEKNIQALLYLSVSTQGVIGQFCGSYFTVWPVPFPRAPLTSEI